jgi:hypothetical protein
MKQNLTPHRRAAALLLAAAALPFTPLAAQDAPVVNAPPPTVTAPPAPAPAPPPLSVAPPPRPVTITPQPAPVATRPLPTVTRAAPAPARPAVRTARAAPRAAAPVRRAAPAPAPVEAAPAPIAATPEPVAAPPAEIAPAAAPAAEPARNLSTLWPWLLAGAALLIAAIAFVAMRRRRRAEEEAYYEEPYYEAPVARDAPVEAAPEPAFVAAVAPAAIVEEVAVADADHADVAALNADSEPAPGRPWLEFLMRPVRAGVDGDDATVEFELTVGNTGSAPARDVRVSTWMVAAGTGTDMERSLIDPPADAQRSELSIPAGDGARVDGAISLPKEGLRGSVLPVVVADARYTLPDGSEGRTHASFAVGLPSDDGLEPFAVDLPTGMQEGVEARLHGEPERV